MKEIVLPVQTKADGTGVAVGQALPGPGLLYSIRLVDGDFDDGVDVMVTMERDGYSYPLYTGTDFNTDKIVCPRVAECDLVGAALASAAMPPISGQPKISVTQGGGNKSGSFILYYLD